MSNNQVQKKSTDIVADLLTKVGIEPGKKLGNAICDLIEGALKIK